MTPTKRRCPQSSSGSELEHVHTAKVKILSLDLHEAKEGVTTVSGRSSPNDYMGGLQFCAILSTIRTAVISLESIEFESMPWEAVESEAAACVPRLGQLLEQQYPPGLQRAVLNFLYEISFGRVHQLNAVSLGPPLVKLLNSSDAELQKATTRVASRLSDQELIVDVPGLRLLISVLDALTETVQTELAEEALVAGILILKRFIMGGRADHDDPIVSAELVRFLHSMRVIALPEVRRCLAVSLREAFKPTVGKWAPFQDSQLARLRSLTEYPSTEMQLAAVSALKDIILTDLKNGLSGTILLRLQLLGLVRGFRKILRSPQGCVRREAVSAIAEITQTVLAHNLYQNQSWVDSILLDGLVSDIVLLVYSLDHWIIHPAVNLYSTLLALGSDLQTEWLTSNDLMAALVFLFWSERHLPEASNLLQQIVAKGQTTQRMNALPKNPLIELFLTEGGTLDWIEGLENIEPVS
eukprot:Protomagalhaensia_sp_Gyna_25__1396@NODE_1703_length_1606_cov_29_453733_g1396_i0_p1_GENE_NODE_1703_length_1606_cov_29_453733_g1396_i0NODE_1703_length_1606_cov_29_453733_g1396_i0_p1_ORF_typecomplete_len468_score71_83HEAT_2/PF13646_6/0_62HEAT_2/PF13646_6/0_46Arm/PF00514_23/6_7e02Arm/PF00514_23/0_0088Arm/PF00514_23/1e02Arm/PF00514_23/3_5e02Arm/PF00514_23/4_9e02KAP/PF05804_12/0_014Adaptin_N/PF01602_20/0_54Adaptin_N/PF01602_20/17Arm_2/PF04826_13/0_14Arm_2/PF04826_13/2_7e03_NODE_1703_length_1606_cov_29